MDNGSQSQVLPGRPADLSARFNSCLVVSGKTPITPQVEEDLHKICQQITKIDVDSLYADVFDLIDLVSLIKLVSPYDAVIGDIPLPVQWQIMRYIKKPVLVFEMETVGTAWSFEEALDLLEKYRNGNDGAIDLPSSKDKPYRVSVYRGIRWINEIRSTGVPIIRH